MAKPTRDSEGSGAVSPPEILPGEVPGKVTLKKLLEKSVEKLPCNSPRVLQSGSSTRGESYERVSTCPYVSECVGTCFYVF